MATSAGALGRQNDAELENIPPLTSIVPSIFIPLEDGLLDPFEPPKDRIERLQRILANIDTHERKVINNAMWMVEREKRRIMMEAKREEDSTHPPEAQLEIDPDETDFLIQNMRTAPEPGVDYNVVDIPLPRHDVVPPNISHRENTTRQLLLVIEEATRNIQGYRTHMKVAKDFYRERLQQEMARDVQFSTRPEVNNSGRVA